MQYEGFLAERESGRPTQYILGTWEFMGLPFSVGEGVLIPRGDTEILVETILETQQAEPLVSILDIGTGSGCIPISLSHYGSFEKIMAVDISTKALGYAMFRFTRVIYFKMCLRRGREGWMRLFPTRPIFPRRILRS